MLTYLAHSSNSSDIARSYYNGLQHTISLSLILIQKVAKLEHTQAKLKTGALLLNHMFGPDGVCLLSELSTLSKIQIVHASYDISRLLSLL